MKKEKITFEQLSVLSFLKFARLDGYDMTLLMNELSDIAEVELDDATDDYFLMADGTIMLSESYVERIYKNVDSELFDSIQVMSIHKYLDNIDMLGFVLRKIKLLGEGFVIKDDVVNNFSGSQINAINQMYQKGYIMDYWEEDAIYDDYQAIKLTKRGELYLFLDDNQKEINDFMVLLREKGYDENLLQAFLITQDLERRPGEILTLSNFLDFCNEYDRCPYASDNKNSGYRRVLKPINQ